MKNKQRILAELYNLKDQNIKIGQVYQHYKNKNYYIITDIVMDANDNDFNFDIIYKDITESNISFRRPLKNFKQTVINMLSEPVNRFDLMLDIPNVNIEKINIFAERAHEVWANWMNYMISLSTVDDKGNIIISKEARNRWQKQSNMKYEHLSDEEKQSDIEIAISYLKLFERK